MPEQLQESLYEKYDTKDNNRYALMTDSEATNPLLDVRLFGELVVKIDGKPLPPLRTRKGLWVLALLTLWHDSEVPRTRLAATLWPESLEDQALSSLRRTLTDLRQALGDRSDLLYAPTPRTIRLNLQNSFTDVLLFDRLVKSTLPADWELAVSLYRGQLIEQCLEEWIFQERTQREEAYLQTLEKLGALSFDLHDYAKAIQHLRTVVNIAPFREWAQRTLLKALAASGDYAAMTLAYRALRLSLHEQLNADPDPETTRLYQHLRTEARAAAKLIPLDGRALADPASLLASTTSLTATREHNLYRPLTQLIGRDTDLSRLFESIESSRLVTLTGIGGVGKTRLATETGWTALSTFPDGVWFVDLTTINEPALVPERLAAVLNLREQPNQPLNETLCNHLTKKRALLIFDNCEHLNDSCAELIHRLLHACPDLHVLATSRQPLGISGERVQVLPPLTVPDWISDGTDHASIPLDVYLQNEALRLFVERCGAVIPSFRLTSSNVSDAADICRRLDGIPLALELAAARVKVLSVSQLASRLQNRFQLLANQSRHTPPRQRTLQALIDWSYDLLTPQERALFRRLAIFVGTFNLEAAENVCTDGAVSRDDLLVLLSELIDKSLVFNTEHKEEQKEEHKTEHKTEHKEDTNPGPHVRRYQLLETVRHYARERLEEEQELERFEVRHRTYFLKFALDTTPRIATEEAPLVLISLEWEHDNLRAALTSFQNHSRGSSEPGAHPDTDFLRLAVSMSRFWHEHGYFREGRAWIEEALLKTPASDTPDDTSEYKRLRARALHGIGMLARDQGDLTSASNAHRESLALSTAIQDRAGEALALNNLGIVAMSHRDTALAREHYHQSLDIAQAIDDRSLMTRLFNNLGGTFLVEKRYPEARQFLVKAREIGKTQSDSRGVIAATGNLAEVCFEEGDYQVASQLWQECLHFDLQRDYKWGIATTYYHLGKVALATGDIDLAEERLTEALRRSTRLGSNSIIADCLGGLASTTLLNGDVDSATILLAGSQHLSAKYGHNTPKQQQQIDLDIRSARHILDPATFERCWNEGASMEIASLVQLALTRQQPSNAL